MTSEINFNKIKEWYYKNDHSLIILLVFCGILLVFMSYYFAIYYYKEYKKDDQNYKKLVGSVFSIDKAKYTVYISVLLVVVSLFLHLYKDTYKKFGFLLIFMVIFVVLSFSYYTYAAFSTETLTASNFKESATRTQLRGTFASVFSAIIGLIVQIIVINLMGLPQDNYILWWGFLSGPILGYIFDMGFGTEQGYSLIKNKKSKEWFGYTTNNLGNSQFFRYVITVFLDLFISDVIQDVLRKFIRPFENSLKLKLLKDKGEIKKFIEAHQNFKKASKEDKLEYDKKYGNYYTNIEVLKKYKNNIELSNESNKNSSKEEQSNENSNNSLDENNKLISKMIGENIDVENEEENTKEKEILSDADAKLISEIFELKQFDYENNNNFESSIDGNFKRMPLELFSGSLGSVLQSFVALVTFQAYTNQTRFLWAYPSVAISDNDKISPNLISLATALSAAIYIGYFNSVNTKEDDKNITQKLGFVIFVITLLYIMNNFGLEKSDTVLTIADFLERYEYSYNTSTKKLKNLTLSEDTNLTKIKNKYSIPESDTDLYIIYGLIAERVYQTYDGVNSQDEIDAQFEKYCEQLGKFSVGKTLPGILSLLIFMLACPILMIKDKFKKNENTNQSNKLELSLIDPADPFSNEKK
jgi:hypothetical protein